MANEQISDELAKTAHELNNMDLEMQNIKNKIGRFHDI